VHEALHRRRGRPPYDWSTRSASRVPAHQGGINAMHAAAIRGGGQRGGARPPHPLRQAARSSYAPTPSWSSSCGNPLEGALLGAPRAHRPSDAFGPWPRPCSKQALEPGRASRQGALRLTERDRTRRPRMAAQVAAMRARAVAPLPVRYQGGRDQTIGSRDERYFRPQGKAG